MDASSAIILYKAKLHLIVCEMYQVVMSPSVYDEITGNIYPGAEGYQQLLADKKITLRVPGIGNFREPDLSALNTLHKGERDVIELYYAGDGDFVITDDGAAARYCKRHQVPFINALLIPVIIEISGKKSDVYTQAVFNRVMGIGRYSDWVINFAEKCDREDLSFFLP
ncbi:MAG: hypothetical protein GY702_13150 [Desulfobulbaceae bacterium]|nr:hypothetical protein [Desulfobulbaceae bacterium]